MPDPLWRSTPPDQIFVFPFVFFSRTLSLISAKPSPAQKDRARPLGTSVTDNILKLQVFNFSAES
jgi:hypothetical protein